MIVQLIKPQGRWKVFRRTKYRLHVPLVVVGHTVPAGFVTDGASLPRLALLFFDPLGLWAEAAVLHDWLLRSHSRPYAAQEFLEAMFSLGVPRPVAYSFYGAVRLRDWVKYGV